MYIVNLFIDDVGFLRLFCEYGTEYELYDHFSEPLFREGVKNGLTFAQQKNVFKKAFESIADIEETEQTDTDRTALLASFLMLKKFNLDGGRFDIIILKDKKLLFERGAFGNQKRYLKDVITKNVRTKQHSQTRLDKGTQRRKGKAKRI